MTVKESNRWTGLWPQADFALSSSRVLYVRISERWPTRVPAQVLSSSLITTLSFCWAWEWSQWDSHNVRLWFQGFLIALPMLNRHLRCIEVVVCFCWCLMAPNQYNIKKDMGSILCDTSTRRSLWRFWHDDCNITIWVLEERQNKPRRTWLRVILRSFSQQVLLYDWQVCVLLHWKYVLFVASQTVALLSSFPGRVSGPSRISLMYLPQSFLALFLYLAWWDAQSPQIPLFSVGNCTPQIETS